MPVITKEQIELVIKALNGPYFGADDLTGEAEEMLDTLLNEAEQGFNAENVNDVLYLLEHPYTDQERKQLLYENDGYIEIFVNAREQVKFMKAWRKKNLQPDSINLVSGEVVSKFGESIPVNPDAVKLVVDDKKTAEGVKVKILTEDATKPSLSFSADGSLKNALHAAAALALEEIAKEGPSFKMDMNHINAAIGEILKLRRDFPGGMESYDDPEAHELEDRLYHAFVRHVAETADGELQVMALKVLETEALKFSRWYE